MPRSRIQTVSDVITEGVIYFMVLFSPWAFGTTQRWSIWTLNITGYVLGGAMALKVIARWRARRRFSVDAGTKRPLTPSLSPSGGEGARRAGEGVRFSSRLTIFQALLTVLILAYCLVSALNARATYDEQTQQFVYHQCLTWLPHSYDSHSSWFAFWNYLALALSFWAIRVWLGAGGRGVSERVSRGVSGGRGMREDTATPHPGPLPERGGEGEEGQRGRDQSSEVSGRRSVVSGQGLGGTEGERESGRAGRWERLPKRWQRLFWVLCLNGALLGAECLVQRIQGSGKLLWLVEPRIIKDAVGQFGPYAYRSNAAQYFNLLWPACLGFWWLLHRAQAGSASRRGQSGPRAYGVILPCVLLMAACAIASLSRGGALVAVGQMIGAAIILVLARQDRRQFWRVGLGVGGFVVLTIFLSGFLDWTNLHQRFSALLEDPGSDRAKIYRHALRMARDFSLWGSGPQTFSPLCQFYFSSANVVWPAQVHNDWLETWITFGGVGFSFIMLALLLVFWRYFGAGGVVTPWPFTALLWLGLVGCLCFAAIDFPFQITSILFLFLLLCAMASCVSRRA